MKIKAASYCILAVISTAVSSCVTRNAYYAKSSKNWEASTRPDSLKLDYSVFLVGDAGNPSKEQQEPVLKLLQQQIYYKDSLSSADTDRPASSLENSTHKKDVVIFLGDNIYESGMPEPAASDRKEKERRIEEQLKIVKNFKGQPIFIPGNHDWNEGKPGGLEAVLREQEFIANYLNRPDVFLPLNGCAGPVELQFNKNLVIILIDSEWWLEKSDRSKASDNDCSAVSKADIIDQLKDIVLRNKGKNILIAEHHPLFSNGTHGGHFSAKDWIFPLTMIRDNAYIPLPVIGSIYPLLRQYGISRQDLSNKEYQQFKRSMLAALGEEKNIIIAAGHEHALQFNKYQDINHITSGGGSKSSPLIPGNGALFAHGHTGFARLNYYTNGQCWVEFWEPEGNGSKGKLVYRSPLYAMPPQNPADNREEKNISYKDSVKMIAAGKEYKAGKVKTELFGKHYRDVWATPVKVNYLDLNGFAGGLSPIKMGGGHQTTSLQLQGKDGNVYQFRTVNKDPGQVLPEGLQRTAADDILQDQISSAHPYAALTIPDMAKAIGIFYASPQLVYMPYSSSLGPYLQQIGGKLGFIEARPDDDLSDFNSFGNAKNAISTTKLYEKLKGDNDNEVDQKMFLRSRLFDLLIGDWDRHEDQWRWAEFKKEKGSVYKPIPRDRDQAFTKLDGAITKLLIYVVHYPQDFKPGIKDPAVLSIGARDLDRNLLNKLSRNDWIEAANAIKNALTDELIENAIRKMPEEAFKLSGREIISKLKSRRNQLLWVAETYYKVLAKQITILGTDKKEFVRIKLGNDSTKVTLYKIDKNDKIDDQIFNRSFSNKETSEIDLYTMGGKDSVIIEGKAEARPVKIRLIGGDGKDFIQDKAVNSHLYVYEDRKKNTILPGPDTRLKLSDHNWTKDFDPINFFNYDNPLVLPDADINADDGIFIGAGFSTTHYQSFGKIPYSSKQSLGFRYAPKTGAKTISYLGDFHSVMGLNTDLLLGAIYQGPQNIFNYFGEGNSSSYNKNDIENFRIRSNTFTLTALLRHTFSNALQAGIGPEFEYYEILKTTGRNISSPLFPEKDQIAAPSSFITIRSFADINFVNDNVFPTTGFRWKNQANYYTEITNSKQKHLQLKSDLSFYATPNFNFPLTFAFHFGGATNIGDYKFFQSNSIGDTYTLGLSPRDANLRGYVNNRFSGRSYLYSNSEMRFPVTAIHNYLFSGTLGLTGFFDVGRVYSDVSESNTWHTGYGPGAWINLFDSVILSGAYGFSKEGSYISIKSGMSF